MDKGVKNLICIITIILIMIAEHGIPVKLSKWDILIYSLMFIGFEMTVGVF